MIESLDELNKAFVDAAPRVLLILIRRFHLSTDEAREALHGVYMSLARRLNSARSEKGEEERIVTRDFDAYLYTSVRNRLIRDGRARQRVEQAERVLLYAVRSMTPEDVLMEKEADSIVEEQLRLLPRAIERLKEPYGQIFKRLLHDHRQLADIADELGISRRSIYSQYQRGLMQIRNELRKLQRKA